MTKPPDRYWDSDRQRWIYFRDCVLHHIDGNPLNNDITNLRTVEIRTNHSPTHQPRNHHG